MIFFNKRGIIEKDLKYLENLIGYLKILMDKTGRLKILVAERDVYALEKLYANCKRVF